MKNKKITTYNSSDESIFSESEVETESETELLKEPHLVIRRHQKKRKCSLFSSQSTVSSTLESKHTKNKIVNRLFHKKIYKSSQEDGEHTSSHIDLSDEMKERLLRDEENNIENFDLEEDESDDNGSEGEEEELRSNAIYPELYIKEHYLGKMEHKCVHCKALHFEAERIKSSKSDEWEFMLCCRNGAIELRFPHCDQNILNFFKNKVNRKKGRKYNSALAFTTNSGVTELYQGNNRGIDTFVINGRLGHVFRNNLAPEEENQLRNSQLYIYDHSEQIIDGIHGVFQDLNRDTLSMLKQTLEDIKPFVQEFKNKREVIREREATANSNVVHIELRAVERPSSYLAQLPTGNNEVAALPLHEGTNGLRLLKLNYRNGEGGELETINQFHELYVKDQW